jgi:hypothetical protein
MSAASQAFWESEVAKLHAEIDQLHWQYGVVSKPERVWQGKCGHLWCHDGRGEAVCPICERVERAEAALEQIAALPDVRADEAATIARRALRANGD